jgi:hypothetical protein
MVGRSGGLQAQSVDSAVEKANWRNIPVTLTNPLFDEGKAQDCEKA